MATLTFIVGYAGSGKSWLFERIVADVKYDDDFFGDESKETEVLEALAAGKDCVLIDAAYCEAEHREAIVAKVKAAAPKTTICWLCFDKRDLEKANKNCMERTNKGNGPGHVRMNQYRLAPRYTYPDGAVILRTWTRGD